MPDIAATSPPSAAAHMAIPLQHMTEQPLLQDAAPALAQVGNSVLPGCLQRPKQCPQIVAGAILGFGLYKLAETGLTQWRLQSHSHHHGSAPPPAGSQAEHTVSPASRYRLDPDLLPPGITAAMVPASPSLNTSQLDTPATACRSLDSYVNGRWRAGLELAGSRSRQGTFDQLRDRSLVVRWQLAEQIAEQAEPTPAEKVIGDLWATAMDHASLQAQALAPLQPELDAIDALSDGTAVEKHLAWLCSQGLSPLQAFSAHPDMNAPWRNLGYLAQGALGLPDSAWYSDPARATTRAAYRQHIARLLALGGATPEAAEHQADDVLALETELAAHALPFAALSGDDALYYNPVALQAAQTAVPGVDWPAFLTAQGQPLDRVFSLGMPAYHQRLAELLHERPIDTWRAYLRFRALDAAAPCLDAPLVAAHEAFHGGVLKGRGAPVPRWAAVLDLIERHAGEAFSESYVPLAYPDDAGTAIKALEQQMRAQFHQHLQTADWLAPETRRAAQEKLQQLRIDTGHPPRWPSWDGAGTDRSSFLHDIHAVQRYVHQRNIALIGQPVDPTVWKLTAQTVDAYYEVGQNRMVLPAAILQPPFFDSNVDPALNYGAIGIVIGHEMAHALFADGSTLDGQGQPKDWWQPQDHARFAVIRAKLQAQANAYSIAGTPVDGALTIDENLADLAGLSVALDALKAATAGSEDPMIDGLTREQRFFANYALCWRLHATPERASLDMATDNHAPPRVRADIGPSNLPAFAQAFNCTANAPMARPESERVVFL